jgi:hypothetical protein
MRCTTTTQHQFSIQKEGIFENTPTVRREINQCLPPLLQMVGDSQEMFNLITSFLKQEFISSGNRAYCILRTDLIMYAHDTQQFKVPHSNPLIFKDYGT